MIEFKSCSSSVVSTLEKMACRNPLQGAVRGLLRPRLGSNNNNFARNAYWRSWTAPRGERPWRSWAKTTLLRGQSLSECLDTISKLLKRQLHVYASQKVRRMEGVLSLYGFLYAENLLQTLASNFSRRFLKSGKTPFYFLFGGTCFAWDREKRISDEELDRCADDFEIIAELERQDEDGQQGKITNALWDVVFKNDHLKLWRRPLDNTYLYEYKAFGRFLDISAKSFLQVQLDLEYRKVWDKYAIKLDTIDNDEDTGSEVIHWVTYYPFPMYSRDYVFTRRCRINCAKNIITLVSKAIDHPKAPISKKHVRVNSYFSQMVIRPHRSMEESGFDFILTYHDDPQTAFPSSCVNWIARSGMPNFLEELHQAAKRYDAYTPSNTMVRDLRSISESTTSQHFAQHSTGQYSM